MTASKLLAAALAKIAHPINWTKGHDVKRIKVRGKTIQCYCARGAIESVPGSGAYMAASRLLVAAIPPKWHAANPAAGVISYNDAPETKHRNVVAWFKLAIKRAKREERASC